MAQLIMHSSPPTMADICKNPGVTDLIHTRKTNFMTKNVTHEYYNQVDNAINSLNEFRIHRSTVRSSSFTSGGTRE